MENVIAHGAEEEGGIDAADAARVGAGAAAGAIVAPLAATVAVEALGFTAGGIAAGSTAAWMMAAEAVAAGGGVAAGGTVATLQFVGAAGLGALAIPFVLVGAVVGAAIVGIGLPVIAGIRLVLEKTIFNPFPGHPNREKSATGAILRRRWFVATEEGPGNVRCYSFDSEAAARHFFNPPPVHLARVLFDDWASEVAAAGWSPWANNTIRDRVAAWRRKARTLSTIRDARALPTVDERFHCHRGFDAFPGPENDAHVIQVGKDGDLAPAFQYCADRDDFGGFAYFRGKAYFRRQCAGELERCKKPSFFNDEVLLCIKKTN